MADTYSKVPNFPDFPELENRILGFWDEGSIFSRLRAQIAGKEPWSFLDGPITANNPMGVHHAWGRTLKDIYNRYHAMRGFDVRFQNGFDCQGLWVEVEVEKEHGFKTKRDILALGIETFVRECKERVLTFSAKQTEQSIRLGYWMDWDDPDRLRALRDAMHEGVEQIEYTGPSGNTITGSPEAVAGKLGSPELGGSYFTFSDENNYTIWSFLKKCHHDGDLGRTTDVMPWCTRCGTGLSQMEVTEGRKIKTHTSVYVRFPIRGRDHEAFLVWTTTPWTLPANVAVALNPKSTYLKVRHGDWIYYVGKDNFEQDRQATLEAEGQREKRNLPSLKRLLKGLGHEPEILEELPGADLLGLSYDAPFDDMASPQRAGGIASIPLTNKAEKSARDAHIAIAWDEVTGGEGTGIVHIAPGAGSEDFQLGLEHGLPIIAPLDPDGIYLEGFGDLSHQHIFDVNPAVVDDLKARDMLVAREEYRHVYPHCWRCGTELVFRLTGGWRIKMDWRDQIMKVVPNATWVPADGEKRELDWLRNMGDWLISKNRFWGLALPIWECDDAGCGWFDAIGSKEELKERATAGWDVFDGHSPHRPYVDAVRIKCGSCGGTASRVPEVGNPWLDAGIVGLSTLRYNTDPEYWKKWFPADLVLESFPGQFRNWFYALLAMSVKMTGEGPFRTLLGHALVHDERGKEMHKSTGNSIPFDQAADKVGAEPMRFIYASQASISNLNFPDIDKKDGGKTLFDEVAVRRIMTFWNCYKFFTSYAEIENWRKSGDGPALAERDVLDRWILSRLESLVGEANRLLASYQVHRLMEQLERFNEDLSNWYLRRSRGRFWSAEASTDKDAAFHTLYEVLKTQIRLLAPILPFLTEEVYQNLVRVAEPDAPESVHLTGYPEADPARIDSQLEAQMAVAIQVKNLGLSLRNQEKIRVRQPLARVLAFAGSEVARATLADPLYQAMLRDELNIGEVEALESDHDVIRPVIKINFRTLGAKLDQKVQLAKKAVEAADPIALHDEVLREGGATISIDGEPFRLEPEDLVISYQQSGSLVAASEGGIVVVLDTELTPELIATGYARDLNREIQSARKDMDLDLTQRIAVTFDTSDEMAAMILANAEFLKGETLAVSIDRGSLGEAARAVEIGDAAVKLKVEPVA